MDNLEWETIPYETDDGEKPVLDFLDSLPEKKAQKVLRDIEVLEAFGPRWGMPHVRSLPDGMFELRTEHGSDIFRTFFFQWHHTVLVLTSGYHKKSQKLDEREFERAKRYRDDWLQRKGGN